jgi:hypothetical protein
MSITIPQTAAAHPTAHDALARDLEVLAEHKQTWATLPVAQKIDLLTAVKRETARVAEASDLLTRPMSRVQSLLGRRLPSYDAPAGPRGEPHA